MQAEISCPKSNGVDSALLTHQPWPCQLADPCKLYLLQVYVFLENPNLLKQGGKVVFPRRQSHLEFSLLFLPIVITAFGGRKGYFSLAIIAFGAFGFIVPARYCRLGKWTKVVWTPSFKEVIIFRVIIVQVSSKGGATERGGISGVWSRGEFGKGCDCNTCRGDYT